ncbi:hypothetical protein N9I36_00475 [Planktomarina temperata]|nr:hypothetical protein [Planktomarina temperata]
MSTLKVDSLVEKTSGNGVHIAGHVIQVVNAEKLNTASTDSTLPSWVDTGLSCTITPKFNNSKIIVSVDAALGINASAYTYFRVVRNIGSGSYSMISEADTPGSRTAIHGMEYDLDNQGQVKLQTFNHLDSPATTSAVTYKVQLATSSGGAYVYMGQSNRDTDSAANDGRASSRIILQEIAQ